MRTVLSGILLLLITILWGCGSGDSGSPDPAAAAVPLQLILIGGPGAGKGTQAERIAERYGIPHISTGEMLRAEVAEGTDLGKRVEAVMQRGELVADSIILRLIDKRLSRVDTKNGFILDGFPRTREQAEGLEPILAKRANSDIHVLLLEVSDAEMIERLLGRGRADDTPETVANRIEKYHRETADAIAYYDQRGSLVRINGEQSIEAVAEDVAAALRALRR